MIIKVGITGGMGSGKSTVAKVFEVLGIPVYYADEAARRIMNEDESIRQQLIQLFGESTYNAGILNRSYLSSIVFNNEEKLAQLNAIVHPVTISDAAAWMQRQTTPYAIKEAALIFESGAQAQLDKVIGVHAPASLCIERVMKRDKISQQAVQARMERQMDEALKMRLCDYVIDNDGGALVIPQVLSVHQQVMAMAARNQ